MEKTQSYTFKTFKSLKDDPRFNDFTIKGVIHAGSSETVPIVALVGIEQREELILFFDSELWQLDDQLVIDHHLAAALIKLDILIELELSVGSLAESVPLLSDCLSPNAFSMFRNDMIGIFYSINAQLALSIGLPISDYMASSLANINDGPIHSLITHTTRIVSTYSPKNADS